MTATAPQQRMIATAASSFNSERAWLQAPALEAPLSQAEIDQVQLEINGIMGTTRENEPIALLVWNGDRRHWKKFHDNWDSTGKPIGDLYERPHVLYKTIFDSEGKRVRDAFPPRWLILTRIEAEQFRPTYAVDSKIWCPVREVFVQFLPADPPPVRMVHWMTIGEHSVGCCQRHEAEGRSCVGKYAHPRHAIEQLLTVRRGMDLAGKPKGDPFAPVDRASVRMIDYRKNNYEDQALEKFRATREQQIDETPFHVTSPQQFMKTHELPELRKALKENAKRDLDALEADLKTKRQEKNS